EFDYITGEYIGPPTGYPRRAPTHREVWSQLSPAERKIASIRKEIKMLIKTGTPVEEARRQMNVKYGKGWRERGLIADCGEQWSEEELAPFMDKKKGKGKP